jgi:antitoxin MazE
MKTQPRQNWDQAFKEMHANCDDELLIPDVFEDEGFQEYDSQIGVDLRLLFDLDPPFDYKAFGEEPATYSPRKHVR